MKKASFFALIVLLMLVLSACSSAAAPTAPAATAPAAATEAPTTAAATAPAADNAQVAGCLGSADKALVDLKCRKVTIAVENAYLPFNFILVKTGEAGGWDYDAWKDICTRLHCVPVFQEAAWEGMIQSVSNKQFDVAADGISVTAERAKIVDFSTGYITVAQRLLVRKGETRFDGMDAFKANEKFILGTQANTTNYETAKKLLPEGRIKAFEQFPFAVQALISGDVDAVLIDEVSGTGYQGQNGDKLELIGPAIEGGELGFIYPKGSDLVGPVNKALQAMKDDGTLDMLAKKYFGSDFKISNSDIK